MAPVFPHRHHKENKTVVMRCYLLLKEVIVSLKYSFLKKQCRNVFGFKDWYLGPSSSGIIRVKQQSHMLHTEHKIFMNNKYNKTYNDIFVTKLVNNYVKGHCKHV